MGDPLWHGSADLAAERLRIAAARADFLDTGDVALDGIPATVAASWQRSRSAGVDAAHLRVPFDDDIDTDSRLIRCARSVLERLTVDMSDIPVSIALTDADARIIDRRDCSAAVGRVLDRVDFNPGFNFNERGVGTNGVGTAFEAGEAVSVVGAAHFHESLVPFACTGAPVLDPLTGRIEGVLDVSLLAESWTPLIHTVVKSAAADIGRNLLLDRDRSRHALFDTYLRATRTRSAVIAVGDTIMVNRRAQHLLSPADQLVVQLHAQHLLARSVDRTDLLELPDGRRLHLRVTEVHAGQSLAGLVLVIDEVDQQDPVAGSSPTGSFTGSTDLGLQDPGNLPLSITASQCPAWVSAGTALAAAIGATRPVLVTGEPGTGRFTLATELFHQLYPDGRQVALDVGDLSPGALLPLPSPGPRETPTLLVLRRLDRVGPGSAPALSRLIASARARPRTCVVATLRADTPTPDAEAVLREFEESVTVPALRHRAVDLPRIVTTLLAELAPGRRLRLSPDASRLIGSYAWPGNLTQLDDALRYAIQRRPVGELRPEDLPAYCRTSRPRRLSRVELAERDAIVNTLAECSGNRTVAAERLGMSRSSIYRKLKAYAIDEA